MSSTLICIFRAWKDPLSRSLKITGSNSFKAPPLWGIKFFVRRNIQFFDKSQAVAWPIFGGRTSLNIYTTTLRRVGDTRVGHGQKFVILMVKMKGFFSWGEGMSPMSSPAYGPEWHACFVSHRWSLYYMFAINCGFNAICILQRKCI